MWPFSGKQKVKGLAPTRRRADESESCDDGGDSSSGSDSRTPTCRHDSHREVYRQFSDSEFDEPDVEAPKKEAVRDSLNMRNTSPEGQQQGVGQSPPPMTPGRNLQPIKGSPGSATTSMSGTPVKGMDAHQLAGDFSFQDNEFMKGKVATAYRSNLTRLDGFVSAGVLGCLLLLLYITTCLQTQVSVISACSHATTMSRFQLDTKKTELHAIMRKATATKHETKSMNVQLNLVAVETTKWENIKHSMIIEMASVKKKFAHLNITTNAMKKQYTTNMGLKAKLEGETKKIDALLQSLKMATENLQE